MVGWLAGWWGFGDFPPVVCGFSFEGGERGSLKGGRFWGCGTYLFIKVVLEDLKSFLGE